MCFGGTKSHTSKWEIISDVLSKGKVARKESRSSEGGQSLVFKNLSTFSDLIVSNLPFCNDEALGTRPEIYQTYYLLPDPELYCYCRPHVGTVRDWRIYSS